MKIFVFAWRGLGFVAPIVLVVLIVLVGVAVDLLLGAGAAEENVRFIVPLCSLIAAGIVWELGHRLNRRDSPNARSSAESAHSFMHLRMEYWAVVYLLLALAVGFG